MIKYRSNLHGPIMMTPKIVAPLIICSLIGCATLGINTITPEQKAYNAGYNSAAKSCNDIMYYGKKYNNNTSITSSGASSLWGLLTTADIGYANAISQFSGQKDAINNQTPVTKPALYRQTSFLDKCNYNANYAQFCKTAYVKYANGYQSESANLNFYDKQQYASGFKDASSDCEKQYISLPIKPLMLK